MARTPMVVPPASFAPTLQQARCAGSTILMRFTSGRARKCWSAIEHDYDQRAAEAQKFYDSGEIETAKSLLKRLLEVAPRESKLYFVLALVRPLRWFKDPFERERKAAFKKHCAHSRGVQQSGVVGGNRQTSLRPGTLHPNE